MEQLSPADQVILDAASVAGSDFSAAAVAAGAGVAEEDAEARCASLARRGHFVRSIGAVEWSDGTVAGRYGFDHQLYREVLYERLPPGRRVRLHRQIGARLEQGYGPHTPEIAAELAGHFLQGRDLPRAVHYLRLAAEQALRRGAYHEAIGYFSTALDEMRSLSDTSERARDELTIQATLAPTLIPVRGWAAPEVEQAYVRARELCQQLGSAPQMLDILYGLATLHEYRGEYRTSQALMEQRLHLAGEPRDGTFLVESHELLACSLFHQGAFAQALRHTQEALARYDPEQHRAVAHVQGKNAGVACHAWAAQVLWFLGYADRAVEGIHRAFERARTLEHHYSIASAQAQAAFVHQYRREAELAASWAEAAITLATEQGFRYRAATGTMLRGWALAALGQPGEGIRQLRLGLSTYRDTGTRMELPYFLALLADALGQDGRAAEGLETTAEALTMVEASRTFFYEAELHRLTGRLLLQTRERSHLDEAEASFLRALTVAREQQAKSLELRTVVSLSQLWVQQGKPADARRLLAETYGWFREGFQTPDLRRTRDLLDKLNSY